MRLKSFHAPTMTEAMQLVRTALGDNAIIVATRDDEQGGVRVTAAIDETLPPEQAPAPEAEIDEGADVIETIASALHRHQTPTDLAERLLAAATQFASEDPLLSLGAALDTHFTYAPIEAEKIGKPLVFVGPPGAGKTLTVAKFATRLSVAGLKATAITADTERAGGIEQLAAFTRLLKMPLMEIEDPHALKDAIAMQSDNPLILLDTPGRNIFEEEDRSEIKALIEAAQGETALVLPANLDSSEALDTAAAYKGLGATRLILTRLDLTRRMGGLLRLAFESRLPLADFSASPKVTEPLQPFNPVSLARLLLPPSRAAEAKKATGTNA